MKRASHESSTCSASGARRGHKRVVLTGRVMWNGRFGRAAHLAQRGLRHVRRSSRCLIDVSERRASDGAFIAAQPARGQSPGARRVRRSPRQPMTARLSLVGRSAPLLAGDVRRRGTVRPVAGARGAWLPDHSRESAFWNTPGRATAQRRAARWTPSRDESIVGACRADGVGGFA